ncbi:zeatin O-xylosyltransferase-like [Humulus lupulus]|uniref:zeatin O-xylosyltransferase-like n=1 Tax=Humulus lupulus TaxID=3486 RepID=UPI002B40D376|nr:zeatin O-xylosyltransferase-like [Humulus lupulus]
MRNIHILALQLLTPRNLRRKKTKKSMETTGVLKELSTQSSVVVVMVPFLAQSHLNQLLQFAHVVSSYNIPVHYVSSTLHNSQVKSRASNPLHQLTKIHFHDYPLPFSPSSTPEPCSGTKFPENFIPCFEATTHLRQPVSDLLRTLSPSSKRLVVVHDALMASVVQDVARIPNGEAYSVNCGSIFAWFGYFCDALGRNDIFPTNNTPPLKSCFPAVINDFIERELQELKYQAGEIFNSCRAIEGTFLQHLVDDIGICGGEKKMWAVGPLHQTTITKELRDQDKWLLEWLDEQEPSSVLYVSFGTTTVFSEEEIKEIAVGLELSGVKFIWALREADKVDELSTDQQGSGRTQLPDGFEERMKKGMGIVVREWVPQVEILGHKSTGGFVSHCGWNSCMESISMGVPIAAWPMHSDQPCNALLLTKLLKVGVAVMEWEQRDELVTSSMISRAVRTLMASDEGGEIRKRAEELGAEVRKSTAEGGVTRMEWDSFIAHITR